MWIARPEPVMNRSSWSSGRIARSIDRTTRAARFATTYAATSASPRASVRSGQFDGIRRYDACRF
jgi:hypothetical protein